MQRSIDIAILQPGGSEALLKRAKDVIEAIHKAFGAPGGYGYGTAQGQALFDLYRLRVEIVAVEDAQ